MAATLAELGMVVSVSGLKQGLDSARAEFRKFHEDASRGAETVRKAWDAVKLALEAIAGFETVKKILDVSDAFHRMEGQLGAIVGSANGGREALKWVEEFGVKTPYSLQTVTRAFHELWAVGINPMTGALQTLADANTAMGGTDESLQRLVGTIALMKEKGAVSLRELQRTLQNELPGAGRIMAQQMGMSLDELDRRVKAGTVGSTQAIDALLAGLHKQFGGAAVADMHTFAGSWKELREEIDQLLRTLGEAGITELAIQFMHLLRDAVKDLRDHVGDARDYVLRFLDAAEQWIVKNRDLVLGITAAVATFAALSIAAPILTAIATGLLAVATIMSGPLGLAALAAGAYTAWRLNILGIRDIVGVFVEDFNLHLQRMRGSIEFARQAILHPVDFVTHGGMDSWSKYNDEMNILIDANQARLPDLLNPIVKMGESLVGEFEKAWGLIGKLVKNQDIFGSAMEGVRAIVDQIEKEIGRTRDILAQVRAQGGGLGTSDYPGGVGTPPTGHVEAVTWAKQVEGFFGGGAHAARTLIDGTGQMGGLAGAALSGDTLGAGMQQMLAQFIVTSQTFKVFSEQLNKIVALLQTVLEPFAPVLTQVADILSELAQVFVPFGKIFVELYFHLNVLTQVLRGAASAIQQILGWLGISVDPSSLDALATVVNNPTVTLRLDTSAAMQSLQRAEDAMLGASSPVQREIARQAYISARDAAVLAAQNMAGQQTPALTPSADPSAGWIGKLNDIFNAINSLPGGIALALVAWPELLAYAVFKALQPALDNVWQQIVGGLASAWNQITGGWRQLLQNISDFTKWIGDSIKWLGGELWSAITWFWDLISTQLWAWTWGAFVWLWNNIGAGLRMVINDLLSGLANILSQLLKALGIDTSGGHLKIGGIQIYDVGSNLIGGGLAMLHPYEAVLPSAYNPSSPGFNPAAFWAPALAALGGHGAGGGSAPIIVIVDAAGNVKGQGAAALSDTARNQILPALQFLAKGGYIAPGTVR